MKAAMWHVFWRTQYAAILQVDQSIGAAIIDVDVKVHEPATRVVPHIAIVKRN
eukprot:TRINITY_DN472_c0_g1_i1.p5 TRINITY_DN472_c0_g1~~TRINITY_DN472_c0_g1_i1.p5  ORF type:complete len:53 (-),score=2.72 TRINITY_DN472_c0_g1_i1:234-392(-)